MANMQLDITFRHVDSSEALKNYAREKIERVSKYVDRPMEGHVVISSERHEKKVDIQIHVHQANLTLRGKAHTGDVYASVDSAVDKIERQVRRYKDKLKHHKPRTTDDSLKVRYGVFAPAGLVDEGSLVDNVEAGPDAPAAGEPESPQPKIIRERELTAKPMSLDEAVMQMDLMNNDFLVYRDAGNQGVNVIYRRSDGNIGLIEAGRE